MFIVVKPYHVLLQEKEYCSVQFYTYTFWYEQNKIIYNQTESTFFANKLDTRSRTLKNKKNKTTLIRKCWAYNAARQNLPW